ncbi:MAG: signal peptidase II [Bdellovibrionota bacterium]
MNSTVPSKNNIKFLSGFLYLLLGLVLCDQVTKYLAQKMFLVSSSAFQIHDFIASSKPIFHVGSDSGLNFSLTYVRNKGAAWGLLGNLPESIRPYFFYVATAVAMIFILYVFFKTAKKNFLTGLGLTLIFSGAVGNYIDRVWLHYVIDWIHVQWKIFSWQYDFPVFNIADSCVTGGVLILIMETFFASKNSDKLPG